MRKWYNRFLSRAYLWWELSCLMRHSGNTILGLPELPQKSLLHFQCAKNFWCFIVKIAAEICLSCSNSSGASLTSYFPLYCFNNGNVSLPFLELPPSIWLIFKKISTLYVSFSFYSESSDCPLLNSTIDARLCTWDLGLLWKLEFSGFFYWNRFWQKKKFLQNQNVLWEKIQFSEIFLFSVGKTKTKCNVLSQLDTD